MTDKISSVLARVLSYTWNFSWILLLLALPITSFPPLARLAGGTLVAPLSIIPLGWLFLTKVPASIIKNRTLPGELKPFFWFIILTLISCCAAFFIRMPVYKGHTVLRDEFEALVTLGIGIAFLLVTLMMIRSSEELKRSLIWINVGGFIFLSFCVFQIATIWFLEGAYPIYLDRLLQFMSIGNLSGQVRGVRISGLTLEPSWLAHSLNMLYLPFWLAASRFQVSAHRFRIGKITLENILLVLGIIAMVMTYSRIGLIGVMAVVAWLLVDIANLVSKRISGRKKSNDTSKKRNAWQRIVITGSFIILLIVGFITLLYLLSFQDDRYKKIFSRTPLYGRRYYQESPGLITLAKRINVGERVVYWKFGWDVFNKYPVLGVGLGNVGRYSEELLSPEAWKMSEIREILLYGSDLPNTKNFWVRILSETGMVGFTLFMSWLIVLWMSARKLGKTENATIKAIGLSGQFVLIALLFEGFSLDTFALPYMWVSLGILIAVFVLRRQPYVQYEKY